MKMIPIDRMWDRVNIARENNDTDLFMTLMYFGEMVVKITGAGLVSAIEDDRDRHRYRQAYRLVRADGIGEWATVIDDILSGTTVQHLGEQVKIEQRELNTKNSSGSWQYDALKYLHSCIYIIKPDFEEFGTSAKGQQWFNYFATLRNKTRGHGTPSSETCSELCRPLEDSIRIFTENFNLFKRSWVFLHRNLSKKYRVTKLTQPSMEFDNLKTEQAVEINLQNGIYVFFDKPKKVDLIYSTAEAQDFLFPNGLFNNKTFEITSYATESLNKIDATDYLAPTTTLPSSETEGIGILEIQGKIFGNLPPMQEGYIQRNDLETQMYNILTNDRHPIVTLLGRGGIGKTWLTLKTLFKISNEGRFDVILWFSARDIDLLSQGPKLVKPHVLTPQEISEEFVRLTQSVENQLKKEKAVNFFGEQMTKSSLGSILFVFDNFETVRSPIELYNWIDTYIRLPNKVLITSRNREFKGDYPIEVSGMNEIESNKLIDMTAKELQIDQLMTDEYKSEIYQESSGHPYVIKILLGEVAKMGKISKVERIVATLDNILETLFERTYSLLSPIAQRVFLTLSSWRSPVPLLAIEAVLLRLC
jgi:hypothetical protein